MYCGVCIYCLQVRKLRLPNQIYISNSCSCICSFIGHYTWWPQRDFFVGNNFHSRWCIWNWFLQSPCSFHTKTGLLHSLAEALKGKPLTLIWNLEMKQSIAAAKYVLTNVPALVLHPHPSARIPLSVDAFSFYFGRVSQQELTSSWAPLAIYSKKLSAPKTKYLFAAYSSLRHFR